MRRFVCSARWCRSLRSYCSFSGSPGIPRDTVFALSSGQGKCGVAVVRTSGPMSSEAVIQLGGGRGEGKQTLPQPRVASVRKIVDPVSKATIDKGLVLWLPGPRSFTGEDSAEFHVHGGSAIVVALLDALSKLPGLRHAEPGDFVKRAFFNGKLDLTEVEGLADLINAETEFQRVQALRQMEGDLSKLYNKWSSVLLRHVAHVEAVIDFGDEENIEPDVLEEVRKGVESLIDGIRHHLNDGRRGERLRDGIQLAIVGAPNVGKSSLLNILCQRPAAIVSPYAGTTRDVVESSLDLFGYPVLLSDTAGIRKAADPVEQEGIKRAVNRSEMADLRILVADCSQLSDSLSPHDLINSPFTELTKHLLRGSSEGLGGDESSTVIVMNKIDTVVDKTVLPHSSWSRVESKAPVCWLSCKTLEGMDSFLDVLKGRLQQLGGVHAGAPSLTQSRHRHNLTECVSSLDMFMEYSRVEEQLVLAADQLRCALDNIGRITGRVGIEDILDVVFSDFCIGK